jgi:release factor glutamine methyltransferase
MKKFPNLVGFGTDLSKNALNIAMENMHLLKINKLFLSQMDCLSAFKTKFDVILANLPYIPTEEVRRLKVTKYEPIQALDGGKRGVEIIFKLIDQIPSHITKPGLVILEIQYDQAMIVKDKVNQILPESNVSILKDYAGLNRFIKIEV